MKKLSVIAALLLCVLITVSIAAPAFSGASYVVINNFRLSYNDDGTLEIAGYEDKTVTTLVIPSSFSNNRVTSIGQRAFANFDKLTSVTIPSSVTSIGNSAFSRCTALERIDIPYGVERMGSNAFYECSSLAGVNIAETLIAIPDYAFNRCSSLTSVVIPDSVSSIGQFSFYMCDNLESVEISNSVMLIDESAFISCPKLQNIVIKCANMDMVIKDNAFDDLYYGKMTLTGAEGSPVQKYAEQNGITFVSDGAVFEAGDVNTDGNVNGADVTRYLKYLVKIEGNALNLKYSDLNGDGDFNVKDATIIQKKIVGLTE